MQSDGPAIYVAGLFNGYSGPVSRKSAGERAQQLCYVDTIAFQRFCKGGRCGNMSTVRTGILQSRAFLSQTAIFL